MNTAEINKQDNKPDSFFTRTINIFGFSMPYWLFVLIVILLIVLVIYYLYDQKEYKVVRPKLEISVPSESPSMTVIDNILKEKY